MNQATTSNSTTTTTMAPSAGMKSVPNDKGATATNQAAKGLFIAQIVAQSPFVGISVQVGLGALLAHQFGVPVQDVGFSVGFPLYMLATNHIFFDNNGPLRRKDPQHGFLKRPLVPDAGASWFPYYMAMATLVGLVAPLATIYGGPKEVALLAAPHLFVLWSQIIVETVAMRSALVHNYIKMLGPVGFSIYRIPMLIQWSSAAWQMLADADANAPLAWYQWSAFLATLGLAVWIYNTFYMLLLRMVPAMLDPELCPSPEKDQSSSSTKKKMFPFAWVGCFLLAIVLSSSSSSRTQKD